MARRIILSVTNDLVTDQRVHRSCTALHEAGYDVTLVGRKLPESVEVRRDYNTVRMRLLFRKKAVFYAEYNIRLFLRLLFIRADLFYANDTDTLLANYFAARIRRKPLFFDAHEMFPEVPELVGRPRVKRFWTRIEDRFFPRLAKGCPRSAAVTVCKSIADIYRERYGLDMGVVRNVPMSYPSDGVNIDALLDSIPEGKKILLYQGAVNIGRGIEWVMEAMPFLPSCQLVVAGTGDIYDQLVSRSKELKYQDRVTFLGCVEPRQLHLLSRHASLGLSLLENRGLNYYYSLPNRISDFIQAGVPVLATDFPEIHRIVSGYEIGTLVEDATDSESLARTIEETLAFWEKMPKAERDKRFRHASSDLNWDNDKQVLLSRINTILR